MPSIAQLKSNEAPVVHEYTGAIQCVGRDLGLSMTLSIHTDSAAAVGICKRAGVGRVRYVAVGQLRVQEDLRRGDSRLFKVQGDANVLTH